MKLTQSIQLKSTQLIFEFTIAESGPNIILEVNGSHKNVKMRTNTARPHGTSGGSTEKCIQLLILGKFLQKCKIAYFHKIKNTLFMVKSS